MTNFTTFIVPARAVAFVAVAQSTEETRYYLKGVHFTSGRCEATDGHLALLHRLDHDIGRPDCILPVSKKARAAMLAAKAHSVRFDGQTLTVRDVEERPLYMEPCLPINGTFLETLHVIDATTTHGATSAAFDSRLVARLCDAATALAESRGSAVPMALFGKNAESPHLVRFAGRSGAFGIIMPYHASIDGTVPAWFAPKED